MKNNNREFLPIGRPLTILLAEDDDADSLLFKEAIEELPLSAELTIVQNGEELIQLLKKREKELPDVLFLDLNMPRKNGFASLGEIKRNPDLENLPVVVFTTAQGKEMIKQVYKDAAHYYIHKPVEFGELKSLIFKALTLITDNTLTLPTKENFLLTVND